MIFFAFLSKFHRKIAFSDCFQNFPNRFFYQPTEDVRTMFDEPSSIAAMLRHYDSVRIAQGVRDKDRMVHCVKSLP